MGAGQEQHLDTVSCVRVGLVDVRRLKDVGQHPCLVSVASRKLVYALCIGKCGSQCLERDVGVSAGDWIEMRSLRLAER